MSTTIAADVAPSPVLLEDLVRRIRTVIEPKRVVLFGSAARGTMGPDSDLDVLVVAGEGVHRIHTSQAIYMALVGFGEPVDVVVVTEGDIERSLGKPGTIITPALEEGRDIYVAAA